MHAALAAWARCARGDEAPAAGRPSAASSPATAPPQASTVRPCVRAPHDGQLPDRAARPRPSAMGSTLASGARARQPTRAPGRSAGSRSGLPLQLDLDERELAARGVDDVVLAHRCAEAGDGGGQARLALL